MTPEMEVVLMICPYGSERFSGGGQRVEHEGKRGFTWLAYPLRLFLPLLKRGKKAAAVNYRVRYGSSVR